MKNIFKKIFYTGEYSVMVSMGLLFLRVMVGVFMMTHGIGKLKMLMGPGEIQFADPIGMGVELSLVLAVFAEFFCSILLIVGLTSRLTAIPLMITMLVAGFVVHATDPFQVKEFALLYGVVFTALLITGPGKFSLDYWIFRQIK
jgi:putative oxidoreductase